jgi:hypothetical protein
MKEMTPNGPSAEQLKNLYIYIEGGLPIRLAANSIGITEATLKQWMAQDPAIEIRVGKAEAHFQLRCIDALVSARDKKGNLNVRAMMFLLEARFPEQFGRRTNVKRGTAKAGTQTQREEEPQSQASETQSKKPTPAPAAPQEGGDSCPPQVPEASYGKKVANMDTATAGKPTPIKPPEIVGNPCF